MSNEYYELLGVTEYASDEEIKENYIRLKKKYNEDRWLEGEAGNEAARMLNKIDTAYTEIMAARREQSRNTEGKDAYQEIAELLKADNLAEAQAKLDAFNERGAEWHYLQAVVFYKKNWSNESKKQLEIAMQMDPNNKKYQEAYGKLNAKNDYAKQSAQSAPNNGENGEPVNDPNAEQMGGSACSDCASCCYTYLCVNCLFNLCCGCR
jgi:curved DNA-binding protein CbpA